MADTKGKIIHCKAAVAWEPKNPLSIETVEVSPPKSGEVRIKIEFTGICGTDLFSSKGLNPAERFPCILGHEAAGIVESVGEDVTGFEPGDHVIPLFVPQCRTCEYCKRSETNFCSRILETQKKGLMPDGTSRFTCKGQLLHHFYGTSTFSEYTVVAAISLAKVNKEAPLDKIYLLGCGVTTGYGAAINTAQVKPGSTCAVFGLGTIGLAAVMGCKKAGATRIIGIDTNPEKSKIAETFGCTEFINPNDFNKPIQEVLIEKTNGGVDYSIECSGSVDVMRSALEATHSGWGVSVVSGIAPANAEIKTHPFELIAGRTWKGTYFGGWKTVDDIPKLVDEYMRKELKLDEFITHHFDLENINDAFDVLSKGESIRSVIHV